MGIQGWNFHNSIWLERAAGVYHREARSGKYKLTYAEAKAVCEFEGGHLATYKQLEAARKIGFHVCAAGWMAKGRVGYPIVKPGPNCGFGKTGIIDYGVRLNRSERWDAYCYNPHAKECGGVFTDSKRIFKSPGFPNEYEDNQICYWHIRLKYGQHIHLSFQILTLKMIQVAWPIMLKYMTVTMMSMALWEDTVEMSFQMTSSVQEMS